MAIIKKPYIGQPLRVKHKTGLDLTDATYVIKALKPDGTTEVTRTATRVGETDVVIATFTATDINQSGEWKFQTIVSYTGTTYPCKTQIQLIYALYF